MQTDVSAHKTIDKSNERYDGTWLISQASTERHEQCYVSGIYGGVSKVEDLERKVILRLEDLSPKRDIL